MTRPTDEHGFCACATCVNPAAAVAADLAEQRRVKCADCANVWANRDCEACGKRLCEGCRVVIGNAMQTELCRDCDKAERCECCGAPHGIQCGCVITPYDGYDPETGPYSDRGCEIHRCRV